MKKFNNESSIIFRFIHNNNYFLQKILILVVLFFSIFILIIFQPTGRLFKPKLGDVLAEDIVVNKDFKYEDVVTNNNIDSIVYKKMKSGQIIARKGDMVTEDNIYIIHSIIDSINSTKEKSINIKTVLTLTLFLISIFIFSYFFIKLVKPTFFNNIKNLLFVSITLFVFVLYITLPIYFGMDRLNIYYGLFIPISTFTLTFVFLYSQMLSCFFSIILSIVLFVVSGFNFSSFLFVFFSGLSSVFTISKVKKRIDLLIAGIIISLINILISGLVILYADKDVKIVDYLLIAFANGIVSSILAIGFIPFGESVLNSPTIFRLQELSDSSSPLMKELFDSAVGTYNHSILVANLAEAAAIEIGANALLARVGGYYHDIGKIDNPEYFIENQGKFNIHNQLKPSISATVIKAHVKKGVERAKKAKLPQKIIDIITQHHGNSLIKYFYEQALKQNNSSKEEINEEIYRYKEEIPQFPESAIILLSDQVEAAARVLRKASTSGIEKLVETIIDSKFQEGIIDDSGLTLKDLTKIKKVFVKHLIGMYHSRIEYPDTHGKSENNNNQSII